MLAEICEEIDTEFLARSRTVVDGCTFAAALLTGTRLFVVWLGDVRRPPRAPAPGSAPGGGWRGMRGRVAATHVASWPRRLLRRPTG